jgi:hypothetical protein
MGEEIQMDMRTRRVMAVTAIGMGVIAATFSGASAPPATGPSDITLRIALPEPNIAPLKIDGPTLHVILQNTSVSPQRILDEWNSAGYFNLTLDCTLADGTHQTMTKQQRGWRMNRASYTTLAPGQFLVRDVYLDPTIWTGVPDLSKKTVLAVTATFTEKPDQQQAWAGTVRSEPAKFTLQREAAGVRNFGGPDSGF